MSKYAPLGEFLRRQKTASVPVSFAEIERIVGHKLPPSSRYPAWWSNNPTNNVMTKIWLNAGFKTEQVDIERRRLVFRRTSGTPAPDSGGRHPLFGALKGQIVVPGDTDLTQPGDPDWGANS